MKTAALSFSAALLIILTPARPAWAADAPPAAGAPAMTRSSILAATPARIEGGGPEQAWWSLAVQQELVTALWRSPGTRALPVSPAGRAVVAICPDVALNCVAQLSRAQQLTVARAMVADGVILPEIVAQAGAWELRLRYVDSQQRERGEVRAPFNPADFKSLLPPLMELLVRMRSGEKLSLDDESLRAIAMPQVLQPAAARIRVEATRVEWPLRFSEQGDQSGSAQMYREQAVILKRATEIDGENYGLWNELGWVHLNMGDTASAIAAFERSLALYPGHVAPSAGLAVALFRDGKKTEAVGLLQAAMARYPALPESRQLMISFMNDSSFKMDPAQRSASIREIQQYLAAHDPKTVWELELNTAYMESNADRNASALVHGQRVLAAMQARYSEAERQRLLEWAQALEITGRALYDLDREQEAEPYLRQALAAFAWHAQKNPGGLDGRLARLQAIYGDTLETLKRFDEALAAYRISGGLYQRVSGPDSSQVASSLRNQGRVLIKKKDYAQAEKVLGEAWQRFGARKEIATDLRLSIVDWLNDALDEQDKDEANLPLLIQRVALAQELNQPPKRISAQRMLANAYYSLKRYKESEQAYRQELTLRNEYVQASDNDAGRAFASERLARSLGQQDRHMEALGFAEQGVVYRQAKLNNATSDSERESALRNLIGSLRIASDIADDANQNQKALDAVRKALELAGPGDRVSKDVRASMLQQSGASLIALNRHAEAIEPLNQAVALWQGQKGAEMKIAIAKGRLSTAHARVGNNALATQTQEESLAIRRSVLGNDNAALSRSIARLADEYLRVDRNDDALSLAREAVTLAQRSFGAADLRTIDARGTYIEVLEELSQYEKAIQEQEEVVKLLAENPGKKSPAYAFALLRWGRLLGQHKNDARSLDMILEGVGLLRAAMGDDKARYADALSTLASAYERLDRYGDALPIRDELVGLSERMAGKDSLRAGTAAAALGRLYMALGDAQRALPNLEKALAIRTRLLGPENSVTASALHASGDALYRLGRHEEAVARFRQALAIREKVYGPDHPSVATTLADIGQYLNSKGQYKESIAVAERALRIYQRALGEMHANTAAALNNLAAAYYGDGQLEKSLPLTLRAAMITQNLGSPSSTAIQLMNLARNYDALNQRPAAIIFGKQAINLMQRVRQQSVGVDRALQRSLLESNSRSYRYVADLLAREGRLAEAQDVLAMLKQEEYLDFVRRDGSELPTATLSRLTPAEAPWLNRYQELGSAIAQLAAELGTLRSNGQGQCERARKLEADLTVANSAFDRITGELLQAFKDAKARQMTAQRIESQGALQETLGEVGEGVVLAQYLVMPTRVAIILTTPNVQIAREFVISEEELNRKVVAYRDALFNPKVDPTPLAQELYRILIAPAAADLAAAKVKTLVLSLDGSLRYLPFSALHDGRQYLVEKVELALFTDAARDKLKDKASGKMRVYGMGVTKSHAGFSALAGVRQELESIVGQRGVTGEVHLDDAFNEASLQNGLAQRFPVMHIASHFKFAAGTEADSFLLMGDGSKLTLKDVRLRYRFAGVDLLTLSACETAFGGGSDSNGREVEGFATLAQTRGARSVLATLWPVADQSTSMLMQTLYRVRGSEQLSKAAALQRAQLGLLRGQNEGAAPVEAGVDTWRGASTQRSGGAGLPAFKPQASAPHAHPYYWAPFILMGNWL